MLTLDHEIFLFHYLEQQTQLALYWIGSCHDIIGIAIHYLIIQNLFLDASWAHKAFVKWFLIIETIAPFVFLLRDEVELSTSVTVYLELSSSVISVFSCFQYSSDLKKGLTDVCYLVNICFKTFWHIFGKKCCWDAVRTIFKHYLLFIFFKIDYYYSYIYHCIYEFLICEHKFNHGIADNQRWLFKVQFHSFQGSKICH